MKSLFDYLPKKTDETRFVVIPAQTLFEPDFSLLNQNRCPLCTNVLKCARMKVWICRSKKHGKPYIITVKRMDELMVNQKERADYLTNKLKA